MAEKLVSFVRIEPQRLESAYLLPDDPRRYHDLVSRASERLLTHWSGMSERQRSRFLRQHFLTLTLDGFNPQLLKVLGLDAQTLTSFPNIVHTIMLQPELVAALPQYLPEKTPAELEQYLQEVVEHQLLPSFFLGATQVAEQPARLISPLSAHPVTAWYTDLAYADLPASIARIRQDSGEDEDEANRALLALATMGYLYGKLSPDHPYAAYYQKVWAAADVPNLPKILQEYLPPADRLGLDSPRLEQLKGYWHQVFVQAWVATARLDHDGIGYLSQRDRQLAQAELATDQTATASRNAAVRQGADLYGRTNDRQLQGQVVSEYDRQRAQLQKQQAAANRQLRTYTDQLLRAYHPDHQSMLDDRGRAHGNWMVFRQKAGQLFQVIVTQALPLIRKGDRGETTAGQETAVATTATTLRRTAAALIEVLHQGNQQFQLSETELFGPEFVHLAPVEQVALMTFTALTLADRHQKPEQTVYLISHRLHDLLQQHHDQRVDQPPPPLATPSLFEHDYQPAIQLAHRQLEQLQPADELLDSQNPQLHAELETRLQRLQGWDRYFTTLKSKLSEVATPLATAGATILSLVAFLAFGISLYETISSQSLEELRNNGGTFYVLLISTVVTGYITYSLWRRIAGVPELRQRLRKLQLLSDQFEQAADRVMDQKLRAEVNYVTIVFLLLALSASAGVGLNFSHDLKAENRFADTEQFDNLDPNVNFYQTLSIPDIVDPERLRRTPHRQEGILFHLPTEVPNQFGQAVGYQPEALVGWNDQAHIDPFRVPFAGYQPVASLMEVGLNPQPNHFIFQDTRITPVVVPLDGYRIVRVYQVGGDPPEIGGLGELYYLHGQLPSELMIVQEPLASPSFQDNWGKVRLYDQHQGYLYAPWAGWESTKQQALATNAELANDPPLQRLHRQLIDTADQLFRQFESGQLNEAQLRRAWSDLSFQASVDFANYVDTHRTYSLQFHFRYAEATAPFLRSVADDPQQGFYCAVANLSFQDFLRSIGVRVLSKPGATMRNYNSRLISRIGHLNSAVLLPDGRVLSTDMTPARPKAGEDLSALNEFPPTNRAEDGLKRLALLAGSLLVTGSAYLSYREVRRRLKKRNLESQLAAQLPDDETLQTAVLRSLEHALLYLYDAASPHHWPALAAAGYDSPSQLYQHLAQDMVRLLTTGKASPLTPAQFSHRINPLRQAGQTEYWQSPPFSADERKAVRHGLKLLRRQFIHAVQEEEAKLWEQLSELEEQLARHQLANTEAESVSESVSSLGNDSTRGQLQQRLTELERQSERLQLYPVVNSLINAILKESRV